METFTAISDTAVVNVGLIVFLIASVLVYILAAIFLYQSQKQLRKECGNKKRILGELIICILCVVLGILLSWLYLLPTLSFLFPIS